MKRQRVSKSSAIAICRATIPNASKRTTTKDKKQAIQKANYRNAGPASTKICKTCQFYDSNGRCTRFNFKCDSNYICDDWLPDIPALRKRSRELTQETKAATGTPTGHTAHGPRGLYSTLGAGRKRKKERSPIQIVAMKRSRGAAEQRAMFAKMGAAGSLQAKGPSGKRTGGKLPSTDTPIEARDRSIKRISSDIKKDIRNAKKIKDPTERIIMLNEAERSARGKVANIGADRIMSNSFYSDISKERVGAKRELRRAGSNLRQYMGGEGKRPKKIPNGTVITLSDGRRFQVDRSNGWILTGNFPRKGGGVQAGSIDIREINGRITNFMTSGEFFQSTRQKQHTPAQIVALKRSRGAAEQRAMFAKMGNSGSAFPRSGGKRMSPQQIERADMKKFLDGLDTGSGSIEDRILPPSGKAPRGQGKEYQTRRWIHSRLQKFEERRAQLRSATRGDRGTKRDVQRLGRNSIAIDSINQTLEVSRHVIKNLLDAGENFTDSRVLFQELFSLPASLLGGL